MTVAEMIKMLKSFKDTSAQVYFDCPHCEQSYGIAQANEVVLVKTVGKKNA